MVNKTEILENGAIINQNVKLRGLTFYNDSKYTKFINFQLVNQKLQI